MDELDHQIRMAAFDWLRKQVDFHGEILDRQLLSKGFEVNGTRIPLVAPQGIFKPRQLDIPLSITTTPDGPYDDSFGSNGLLRYKYRGTDPQHRDNRGLREAMFESKPLVYLHGIVPSRYLAVWPVYIVGDEPEKLAFSVAADDYYTTLDIDDSVSTEDPTPRRAYVTATVRRRLHQQGFRERVLHAYKKQCALCELRRSELLDAAHIVPDSEPRGIPEVKNGISMCKLHHAAYDRRVIGIDSDHQVHVREDVLNEIDGPMLQHGLQEMHGRRLILPRSQEQWPDRELLDERFQLFTEA